MVRTNGQVSLSFESAARGDDCSNGSVELRLRQDLKGDDGRPSMGYAVDDGEWIAFDSRPEWLYCFNYTALHEIGHYLTGLYHSDNPRDIMYPEWTEYQSGHLTKSDIDRFFITEE